MGFFAYVCHNEEPQPTTPLQIMTLFFAQEKTEWDLDKVAIRAER